MTFSLRVLFAASALVALFLGALLSQSNFAAKLTALIFINLSLMSIPLAILSRSGRKFWIGFSALAVGTLLFAHHTTLYDDLANSIGARWRTTLPSGGYSVPYNFAVRPQVGYALYSYEDYSLKELLIASFALAFGTIGGCISAWSTRVPEVVSRPRPHDAID